MGSKGFFKGEKKKAKKGKEKNNSTMAILSNAPTYSMPEVITKKKSE